MSRFVATPASEITLSVTPSDSANTLIKDGWFAETEAMWPGQKFCIEVDEVLLNGKSKFQVSSVVAYLVQYLWCCGLCSMITIILAPV
jgi:hypothetical protein